MIALHNKATLFWIHGHRGYKGNEKPNEIAKRGVAGHGSCRWYKDIMGKDIQI